ncbi:MAG TPA: hypothetical protein VN653_03425 [Anaerolineales bacterium]|nr:hypothetical protein [Anaerolineales bacterium]
MGIFVSFGGSGRWILYDIVAGYNRLEISLKIAFAEMGKRIEEMTEAGDLLARLGGFDEARMEFERAETLTHNEPERALLFERAKAASDNSL